MKIKNINVVKSVCFLITIFYSYFLHAQPYSGGSNSGSSVLSTSVVNCTVTRFAGGINAGNAIINTTLQNCNTLRFSGDSSDGYAQLSTALQNCTTLRFSGGTANGFSMLATLLQNCTTLRFSGDSSDGFSLLATALQNCTFARFSGSTGSGYTASKFTLLRNFLGNDTSITLICNTETYNLLSLYNAPGLTYNWNTGTPATAPLGNYQLIAMNQSGCFDTALTTLKQEIAKWNGSISNDWHNAANWNNGKVPDEKTHVIITGGTPNPCHISFSDAKAASVQAKTAGSFSIINNRILVISGTCITLPPG